MKIERLMALVVYVKVAVDVYNIIANDISVTDSVLSRGTFY